MANGPDAHAEPLTFGSRALTRLGDLWVARRTKRRADRIAEHRIPAIVVIGASRGIGRAFSERALRDGHHVCAVARSQDALNALRAALPPALQARWHVMVQDITAHDAPARLLTQVHDAGLTADVVVMNAGIGLSGPFVLAEPAKIDELTVLNVAAVARLARTVLAARIDAGRGGLILMSSLGAAAPGPNQALYYASKAFVTSLSEALAFEAAGTGVRVCCVMPGPVATFFHRDMGADDAPYRRLLFQLSPEAVVSASIRGYALGMRVVVPGTLNKLMYVALKIMPRRVSALIVGKLLGWNAPTS